MGGISRNALSLLLLISALSAVFCGASKDAPFIVAHKKASLHRVNSGSERVSVSIDVYNQGSSTAFDISLVDDHWPQDIFNVISGNTSRSWERLDAGGILSHSFELEAKQKGLFYGSPAVITFRIPTKAAFQEAYSSPIPPLDVLAERPPEKKFEWAKKHLARHGSQVSVIAIVALFVYIVASPSKSSSGKASKKRR